MSKFKVGDKVKRIRPCYINGRDGIEGVIEGGIYKVASIDSTFLGLEGIFGRTDANPFREDGFELVEETKPKVNIHKLTKKIDVGYRCVTNDKIIFETDNARSMLTIDGINTKLMIDLTPHTIEMLSEFFRYLKSDLDEN